MASGSTLTLQLSQERLRRQIVVRGTSQKNPLQEPLFAVVQDTQFPPPKVEASCRHCVGSNREPVCMLGSSVVHQSSSFVTLRSVRSNPLAFVFQYDGLLHLSWPTAKQRLPGTRKAPWRTCHLALHPCRRLQLGPNVPMWVTSNRCYFGTSVWVVFAGFSACRVVCACRLSPLPTDEPLSSY